MTRLIPIFVCLAAFAAFTARAAAQSPERVEIVAPRADLKAGTQTVGTVTQGQTFDVVEKQGGYYQINADIGGKQVSGWVYENQLRLLPPVVVRNDDPPATEYLVVTAAGDVQSGADVVGRVAPGEIYRLLSDASPWLEIEYAAADGPRRGFIQAKSVNRVAERDVASLRPGVLAQSTSTATAETDWETGVVTLRARPPLGGATTPLTLAAATSDDVLAAKLEIERTDDGVTLSGTWPALRSRLVPGTRSLWLSTAASSQHRLDLAPAKLGTAVDSARYDEHPGLQFVLVPVENLLPGAAVLFAETSGKDPFVLRPLETDKAFVPRLVDSYRFENRTYLRVAVADVGDKHSGYLYLQVRNPDGGLSNSIAVTRRGKTLVRPATAFDDAAPLPVDTATVMPAVELLTLAEARDRLKAAGLEVRAVHHRTLKTIDAAASAVVERQALPAGSRQLLGRECLVAVRPADETLGAFAPTIADGKAVSAEPATTIAVDDQLGFASIHLGHLQVDPRRRNAVDDAKTAAAADAPHWLALGTDVGVALDPSRSAEADAEAAFLKLLLAAARDRSDLRDGAGEVGRALAQPVAATEADWPTWLAAIERELGIGPLTELQRAALLSEWKTRVDGDAAAWLIARLYDHGHYHPRRRTRLAADAGGTPLALVNPASSTDAAPAQNWFQREQAAIVVPGAAGIPSTASIGAATTSAAAEKSARRGPQRVRVPTLLDDLVATVDGRFREIGLVTAEPQTLFTTDKVVSSAPEQQTWVDSGTVVTLGIHRQIPSVVGLAPEQVAPHLALWKLEHRPRGPADEGNVAVEQVPAEGGYLPLDKPVEVEFHAVAPPVVGRLVAAADPFLEAARLKRVADTKMFAEDKIMEQSPAAGVLIDHGKEMKITVHTPVPPVNGLTLAEALVSTDQWDFVADVPNQYVHQDDRVRGQNPAPGTFIPHRSKLKIDPVKGPVPNLVGMTVLDASTQLAEREHYTPELVGELIGSDLVTAQTPVAGTEHERGLIVTLDARVPTPDLTKLPIRDAMDKVRNAAGRLTPVVADAVGEHDLVYSQDPKPGTSIFPRTTVTIVPGIEIPNLNKVSPEQAAETLAKLSLKGAVTARPDLETRDFGEIGRLLVTGQNPSPGFYPSRDIDTVAIALGRMVLAVRTVPPSGENTNWTNLVAAIEAQNLVVSAVVVVGANGGEQRLSLSQFRGRRFGNARLEVLGTIPAGGTSVVAGTGVVLQIFQHEPASK